MKIVKFLLTTALMLFVNVTIVAYGTKTQDGTTKDVLLDMYIPGSSWFPTEGSAGQRSPARPQILPTVTYDTDSRSLCFTGEAEFATYEYYIVEGNDSILLSGELILSIYETVTIELSDLMEGNYSIILCSGGKYYKGNFQI